MLEQRLQRRLPGAESQQEMSPVKGYDHHKYYQQSSTARQAGVLALVIRESGSGCLKLLYIVRRSKKDDVHSGQISFPGGGLEIQDQHLEATALRETEEEVGIQRGSIKIIGALTPLYVFASDNMVYPYVGYAKEPPRWKLQADEVDAILTPEVEVLSHLDTKRRTTINTPRGTLKNVPYYAIGDHVLWGATAMITAEFLQLWKEKDQL
ncbi:MAG: CoA pyrophosphatase [Bacteroidota bacterium]